jgi:hypothetical protein
MAVVACGYDQRGGQAIADSIRTSSPLVQAVDYRPGTMEEPPVIQVGVRSGVTRTEAIGLVCNVIKPIIAAGKPPDKLEVEVYDLATFQSLAHDTEPCA